MRYGWTEGGRTGLVDVVVGVLLLELAEVGGRSLSLSGGSGVLVGGPHLV